MREHKGLLRPFHLACIALPGLAGAVDALSASLKTGKQNDVQALKEQPWNVSLKVVKKTWKAPKAVLVK